MLLVPILQLVTVGGQQQNTFISYLERVLGRIGVSFTLKSGLTVFFIIFIIQITFYYMRETQIAKNIVYFKIWLRNRLYRAIFFAKWPFFLKQKKGLLINSILIECEKAGHAFYEFMLLCSTVALVFIYSSVAFLISWKFTSMIFLLSILLPVGLRRIIKRGRNIGKTTAEVNGEFQSTLSEHFDSAKLIKGSGLEEMAANLMSQKARLLAELEQDTLKSYAKLRSYAEPIAVAILCVGIYTAIEIFKIDIASLIVLLFIFFRLFPKVMLIQQQHFMTTVYIPSFEHVESLTEETTALKESYIGTGSPFTSLNKGIEFRNVSYSYGDKNKPVLKDVSFYIERNETIALVGSSGAGKSTISDMILGLLHPDKGVVLLDGEPLSRYELLSWRRHIGYVTQETILLHDTVRANILWGLGGEISEQEIRRVAKLAHAHEFIEKLQNGYDTLIGDRGVRLSGGQRQRLALARTLARNPQLLILDEATSSLDAESEAQVQKAIDDLAQSTTIFVIAHRLSTIKNADRIYVLEDGNIVESGTWQQLSCGNGRFHQLYKLQMSGQP